jgi:hypothetical protein
MNQQLIEQAIRAKAIIEFTYSDHHRVVEPHVLGLKDGAIQFLGYQIGGTSSSGGLLPEWRRFDLVKIFGLFVTVRVSGTSPVSFRPAQRLGSRDSYS